MYVFDLVQCVCVHTQTGETQLRGTSKKGGGGGEMCPHDDCYVIILCDYNLTTKMDEVLFLTLHPTDNATMQRDF